MSNCSPLGETTCLATAGSSQLSIERSCRPWQAQHAACGTLACARSPWAVLYRQQPLLLLLLYMTFCSGKFDLGFTDSHLLLKARQNNHNSAQVPWSDLEHVVVRRQAPGSSRGSQLRLLQTLQLLANTAQHTVMFEHLGLDATRS